MSGRTGGRFRSIAPEYVFAARNPSGARLRWLWVGIYRGVMRCRYVDCAFSATATANRWRSTWRFLQAHQSQRCCPPSSS
jgi:hypothetical protein